MTETMQAPTMATAPPALDDLVEALVRRATTDADFRARALADPASAIEEVAGRPLPDGYVLALFDNARAQLSLVLPESTPGASMPADVRASFAPGLEWTEAEAKLATAAVLARVAADPAFRARALADAGAAIRELTGKALPEGFTVRFFDGAGATRAVILPDMPEARTELSEAELAAVAGGGKGFKQVFSGVFGVLGAATGGIVGLFVPPAGVGIDIGTAAVSTAACS